MADKATLPSEVNIDSTLQEQRKFESPPQFAEKAHVKTMAEQHLNAQHECHEQGDGVFKDVGTIFVAAYMQAEAIDV